MLPGFGQSLSLSANTPSSRDASISSSVGALDPPAPLLWPASVCVPSTPMLQLLAASTPGAPSFMSLLRGGCGASPWLRPLSPSALPVDFPAGGCEPWECIRTALRRSGQAERQLPQETPPGLAAALGLRGSSKRRGWSEHLSVGGLSQDKSEGWNREERSRSPLLT